MGTFVSTIVSNNTVQNKRIANRGKKTIFMLVLTAVIIGGGGFIGYRTVWAPHAKEKAVTRRFLAGMYEGKTKPIDVKKMATPELQVAKSENDFVVGKDAEQRIKSISYSNIDATNSDTTLVTGTMKSDQPVANPGSKDVITNSFALRLAKVGGEWKVDAYLVQ